MSALAMRSFGFGEKLVRAFDRDGNAWFVANDVCAALEIGNSRQAVSRLDDDERDCVTTNDAMDRRRETTIVSESGVYALIFTSRKAAARTFRKWVTAEVLPALRRKGEYRMEIAEPDAPAFASPDEFEIIRTKLAMVKEARVVFGHRGARAAWRTLGLLPEVVESFDQPKGLMDVVAEVNRSVLDWLSARTESAPGSRTPTMVLYHDYLSWVATAAIDPVEVQTIAGFGQSLTRCGIPAISSNGRKRVGIRLAA